MKERTSKAERRAAQEAQRAAKKAAEESGMCIETEEISRAFPYSPAERGVYVVCLSSAKVSVDNRVVGRRPILCAMQCSCCRRLHV